MNNVLLLLLLLLSGHMEMTGGVCGYRQHIVTGFDRQACIGLAI